MVSAVFHSPVAAASDGSAIKTEAAPAHSAGAGGLKDVKPATPAWQEQPGPGYDWSGLLLKVLPPIFGLALLVGI